MEQQFFSYTALAGFVHQIFIKIGCSEADASLAAKVLLSADIRGVDSHGVARLSGYVRLWETKRVNANPSVHIIHETPSTAVVDGDSGLGLVVAPYAMQVAIDKAKNVGSGWVSVQNSNHFGIAGYHAMMALEQDMIGIAMTNASALVAPTFSIERMLGTNPIAVAIPAGDEPPFVADMATTTAANGKLEMLQRKEQPAPEGWIQNAEGNTTTDAHALKTGGALLPLGSDREHGSHKGYALGAIVDLFSGVPMPENMPGKGIGHFFGAMRIDAFRKAELFKADMDTWIQRFRAARPAAGYDKVLIPGDPEREMEKERMEKGIPLLPVVIEDLKSVGEKFSVVFTNM
jgi:LDH2 family malate/lactate/ureidoglycolate dehydrogenase